MGLISKPERLSLSLSETVGSDAWLPFEETSVFDFRLEKVCFHSALTISERVELLRWFVASVMARTFVLVCRSSEGLSFASTRARSRRKCSWCKGGTSNMVPRKPSV